MEFVLQIYKSEKPISFINHDYQKLINLIKFCLNYIMDAYLIL